MGIDVQSNKKGEKLPPHADRCVLLRLGILTVSRFSDEISIKLKSVQYTYVIPAIPLCPIMSGKMSILVINGISQGIAEGFFTGKNSFLKDIL